MPSFRSSIIFALNGALVACIPLIIILRFIFQASRSSSKPISVWTGQPIINIVHNAKAESTLGFSCYTVVPYSYFITSEFDFDLSKIARSHAGSFLLRYVACALMCIAASNVHVYIDGGILPQRTRRTCNQVELFIYRLLGIKVFAWAYGGDVRSRAITINTGHPNCCTDCTQVMLACACDENVAMANYAQVFRSSVAVFSQGDMIEYTPNSHNDLFYWPIDLDSNSGEKYRPSFPSPTQCGNIVFLHAPNHREFKGTRYIEAAFDHLKKKGLPVELILVEKVPNDRALELYRQADVIIDQVIGGYHGFFALEAMAIGKPVMCFIRKPATYLLDPTACPIINTSIHTLLTDLEQLISDRSVLRAIGVRGRQYVEQHYSLEAFAQRLRLKYIELGIIQ